VFGGINQSYPFKLFTQTGVLVINLEAVETSVLKKLGSESALNSEL
jgi:hypothetical protein